MSTATGFGGRMNRRGMLRSAAGAGLGAMALGIAGCEEAQKVGGGAALKGHINHSMVWWCFEKYWTTEQMCEVAKSLGLKSVELIEPEHWPTLKKHGLVCAIHGSHGFVQGMNNPAYHDMCIAKIKESVDICAEYGFPNVITFTGMSEDIPADAGQKNCIEGLKKVVGYAEQKKVNLCLEMLNSRDAVEMKGHPGYQGDHMDYCIEIVKAVGSPRMKVLFDIYHVQIMDGDIIRRIGQYAEYIGHVHTAGCPGRNELDDTQEINYPPIMRALVKAGYTGYTGHEFIPTRDPLKGLAEAVALCDV